MEELIQPLCYGLTQGNKARIANLMQQGFALDPDDAYYAKSTTIADPGEHISALRIAVGLMADNVPQDAQDAFAKLKDAVSQLSERYRAGLPIGADINDTRVRAVGFLRALPEPLSETVIELLANAEPPLIIDLNAPMNEGLKP